MKYSEGFKASVVKRTQDGSGRTIAQVAREVGLSIVCRPLIQKELF
jgi:transposase-like protein